MVQRHVGTACGRSRLLGALVEGGERTGCRGTGCACTISAAARQRLRRKHLRRRCVSAVSWLWRKRCRGGSRRDGTAEAYLRGGGPSSAVAGARPLAGSKPQSGPDTEDGRSTRELGWRMLGISLESSACDSPDVLLARLPGRPGRRVSPGYRPLQAGGCSGIQQLAC